MHFHNFSLTIIIYTLTFSLRMKHSNANSDQIVSEFFSDDPDLKFTHLAVDYNEGSVYIAASYDHLFQLSADLKSQINFTSMELMFSNCTPNCEYTLDGKWKNSYYCQSTSLELDYRNQQLVVCQNCQLGFHKPTRYLEVCCAHNIHNLTEILAHAAEHYASYKTKHVSFVGPSLMPNSSALYYGFKFMYETISKISILHLDRKHISYNKQIIMNYKSHFDEYFYGFKSEDSSYFLAKGMSVSQLAVNSDPSVEANLIEIKHEDQNYQFDDVLLICSFFRQKLSINETLPTDSMGFQHAYFYEHKSDSELKTDSQEIEGKILFVTVPVGPARDSDNVTGFKVCAYNMNNIHSTIQKRRVLNGEIIYEYAGNRNYVSAMTVTSINNHIVLFIGTTKGHLQKISIRLDSSHAYTTNIYADITIDQGSFISNMLFDSKKNFLYAMTKKKLAKIKIHNCDEYNTSYACLNAKDPYCGWCFLRNRCCLKSECSNYEQNRIEWISYDIDKYVNTSSSARNYFSRRAESDVTLNLLNSHPFNDHKIICSFRFNNTIINTTTSVSNKNQINCPTPNNTALPPIPINEHSIKAQLSVQTNIIPEFQKIEVEFFDCSTYELCKQCLRSTLCNWHITEHKCTHEASGRSNDIIRGDNSNESDVQSINKVIPHHRCPSFADTYGYTRFYIHANTGNKESIIATLQIPEILINETFTCKFDTEENTTITSASLQSTYQPSQFNGYVGIIKCDDTIFTYAAPKPTITAKWSILWNGSKPLENPRNHTIVLYKCANTGNQCANCLNKNYECKWNTKTGECKYNNNNSSDVEPDNNNHWLNDIEKCSNEPFVIENIKNRTNWLTDNIYWIIIIIMTVTLVTVAIFFVYCRNSAERSRKMQRQLNKMGMEMIAMSQWVKRVVIENEVNLDENDSNMLRLPNVTIQYTSIPRFAENETVPKDEYELPPDHKWEIPRRNVILGKCLGEGQFGKVVEAKVSGLLQQNVVTTAAVKMLKNSHTDADMVNLVMEMHLMKIIGGHENVLRLLGCCTMGGPTLLITEYSPHGNLLDFLQKNHHPTTAQKVTQYDLSEKVLITFAVQIAKGMEYLASIRFVHRDLAARNILVFDNNVVKIADFGLARDIRKVDYYKLKTGGKLPVKWMAPETMKDRRHTSKSDVWSYGVLLWEIMTLGGDPYPLYNDAKKLMDDIESGYRLKKPANCPINTYCLMCKCWNYLPADRPEFTNIIKDLDAILMNFDKAVEQPDPPSSNYSSTTESDDTDDETNAIKQPDSHSSSYAIESDNTDDETNDLLKNCIEIE